MSFGFYRMPPGSTDEDLILKIAGKTTIVAFGYDVSQVTAAAQTKVSDSDTEIDRTKVLEARAQGYSGDICSNCQGARLKWAGHCMVCDDCGQTTGCS